MVVPGRTLVTIALFAVLLVGPAPVRCDEPVAGDHVVLRSGRILAGRVVGSTSVENTRMWRIETDFGQILVPRAEVKKRVSARRPAQDEVLRMRRIRVIQWKGTVERRLADETRWRRLGETQRYAKRDQGNVPNSVIQPGDTIRTGPDGTVDLMPHKDVWIRIAPNSEVEIPAAKEDATLKLTRGSTIQSIRGKPRQQVYRVRTPSSVVDHEFVLGGEKSFFSLRSGKTDRLVVKTGGARLNGQRVEAGRALDTDGSSERVEPAALRALPDRAPRFPEDDLVYVPPGTYTVGGDAYQYDGGGKRTTRTKYGCEEFEVTVGGFLIDRREVSAEEFHAFATTPQRGALRRIDYPEPPADRARWPAVHLSWRQAHLFAQWCGKALPTEAQWEVAAHGGTQRRHPWGNRFGKKHAELSRGHWGKLWFPQTSFEPVDAQTVDVSPFGVRSLVSNATEWCRDDWRASPFHAHMPLPLDCTGKVVRGTLGHMRLRWCMRPDGVGDLMPGFRCVVELD